MFQIGCLALAIAGQTLCFSDGKITCSDQPISGIERCVEQSKRLQMNWKACVKAKACSADGSSSSTFIMK